MKASNPAPRMLPAVLAKKKQTNKQTYEKKIENHSKAFEQNG